MKITNRLASLIALALLISLSTARPADAQIASSLSVPATPAKKLISYGWGSPNTQYVREHWREIAQSPFDGLGVTVAIDRNKPTEGDGATENILGWHLFGPRAFDIKQFQPAIDDLKAVGSTELRANLFPTAIIASSDQDHGLNWFDDARWKTVANNWRVLMTIAHEGGCSGILFDPEHYDYKCELFNYQHHKAQRADRPFAEYRAKARQRGREVMQAGRQVFPEAKILSLYAYGIVDIQRKRGTPLEENRYALLPDFLDGMLEAADPRFRFYDLWEFAYGYKERREFLEGYHTIMNRLPELTSVPELYRRYFRAGFGIWIDPRGEDLADATKSYFTPETFGNSLQTALDVSDEYVWIYNQNARFFPRTGLPDNYWDVLQKARKTLAP